MQLKMYCILDTKVGAYLPPEFFHNDAQAIRIFGDAVLQSKGNLNKHPEDFCFYCVGSFDDQSATFKVTEPVYLAKALDFNAAVVNKFEVENQELKSQLEEAIKEIEKLEKELKK